MNIKKDDLEGNILPIKKVRKVEKNKPKHKIHVEFESDLPIERLGKVRKGEKRMKGKNWLIDADDDY